MSTTSRNAFERDWEAGRRSLRAGWACVGRVSEMASESYRGVELDGVDLLLTRDRDGEVRAFFNVCSHRGHPLASALCTRAGRVSCPYHGWSYALDGRLRSTPHIGGPGIHESEGFDRAQHGLKDVPCAVWWDLIFVNLDAQAAPFADVVAPLEARWARYLGSEGLSAFVPIREPGFTLEVQGPWSLAVENFCESYHLPFVHPALNSYSRLEDHFTIVCEKHFAGQGTRVYEPRYLQGEALPSLPVWPQPDIMVAEYIALFPNLLLGLHHDHAFVVRLEGVSESRTVEHCDLYMLPSAATSEQYANARAKTRDAWISVFEEDVPVVEGMARGRRSPAYTGGAFSPVLETGSMTFYDWMNAAGRRGTPVKLHSA